MALADHMSRLNSCESGGSRNEALEAKHRPRDLFYKSMVLLENIVQIFGLYDPNQFTRILEFENHVDLFQACKIGSTFVDHRAFRHAIGADSRL